jgi:drug/metabolite transporter (DMT)-like permease
MEATTSTMAWLTPTLIALFLYGIGQGLVKKFIDEVPPARYCLYFFLAKLVLYLGYYVQQGAAPILHEGKWEAVTYGVISYVLEGLGWICYYESIVSGPISIVGTLSAAYGAPTAIFSFLFLKEVLPGYQYAGVILVIIGCAGVSYAPADPDAKVTTRRWIPLALMALLFWGLWQTGVKFTYEKTGVSEGQMALYSCIGAFLTLGLYGLVFGRGGQQSRSGELLRALLPMMMMAGGDLGVLIATRFGSVTLVTVISSAYPAVTLLFAGWLLKERISAFQWACIILILTGMVLGQDLSEIFPSLAAQAEGITPSPAP